MIVISTITNGPYWRSSFEPMLYPSGVSFYRPFSYRQQWISNEIRSELFHQNFNPKSWLKQHSNDALFCIRFIGENAGTVIPIRKVLIDKLNAGPPTHIYFRLGPFVDYRSRAF